MTTQVSPDGEPTLADVQAEFPGWQCTGGGPGQMCCARRDDIYVRGEDPWDLRNEIRRFLSHEEQAAWQAAHPVHGAP